MRIIDELKLKRQWKKEKTVVVYKNVEESVSEEKKADDSTTANGEIAKTPLPTVGQLSAQQQTLMDESGKMLEYVRKEVLKLRRENVQLKHDYDLLMGNNQRLMDANVSAGASFDALSQHADQLSNTNAKIQVEAEKYKDQAHELNLTQIEMKEELKMKQGTYIAEVHFRLRYQKTMAQIVETIQERCHDCRLVEDVLMMSDECESDHMSGLSGVDLSTTRSASARKSTNTPASFTSRFKSFFVGD